MENMSAQAFHMGAQSSVSRSVGVIIMRRCIRWIRRGHRSAVASHCHRARFSAEPCFPLWLVGSVCSFPPRLSIGFFLGGGLRAEWDFVYMAHTCVPSLPCWLVFICEIVRLPFRAPPRYHRLIKETFLIIVVGSPISTNVTTYVLSQDTFSIA